VSDRLACRPWTAPYTRGGRPGSSCAAAGALDVPPWLRLLWHSKLLESPLDEIGGSARVLTGFVDTSVASAKLRQHASFRAHYIKQTLIQIKRSERAERSPSTLT
jgi:hypothetical protein